MNSDNIHGNFDNINNDDDIPLNFEITDFEALPYLYHDKKQVILKLLLSEELNIKSISDRIKMNPGTVRRHLDDLIEKDLVKLMRKEKNEWGQKEKFYRTTGRKFIININFEWPSKEEKDI